MLVLPQASHTYSLFKTMMMMNIKIINETNNLKVNVSPQTIDKPYSIRRVMMMNIEIINETNNLKMEVPPQTIAKPFTLTLFVNGNDDDNQNNQ